MSQLYVTRPREPTCKSSSTRRTFATVPSKTKPVARKKIVPRSELAFLRATPASTSVWVTSGGSLQSGQSASRRKSCVVNGDFPAIKSYSPIRYNLHEHNTSAGRVWPIERSANRLFSAFTRVTRRPLIP